MTAPSEPDPVRLRHLVVQRQPDDFTCGPTCLQAIYEYFGDPLHLDDVIAGVETTVGGGTLAVNLACHALERGYDALIYTYNLNVFDPSWASLDSAQVVGKLNEQRRFKRDARIQLTTRAYLRFFELGGRLSFEELSSALMERHLSKGIPILTGLSATYLYGCAREYAEHYDDVRGEPAGHFVVLNGYNAARHEVSVTDPLHDNPSYPENPYIVKDQRLAAAVLLGVLTYDANLLVITPQTKNS